MYTISTASLLSIIVLASTLAVSVQADNHFKDPGCIDFLPATATSCRAWLPDVLPSRSETELVDEVHNYNKYVNEACTNLIIGDNYCLACRPSEGNPCPPMSPL